jgi:hypothetical protein
MLTCQGSFVHYGHPVYVDGLTGGDANTTADREGRSFHFLASAGLS